MVHFLGTYSCKIHMIILGGVSAFVGALIAGPRKSRFTDQWKGPGEKGHINAAHSLWTALGTFLLWYGWYGFNIGSVLTLGNSKPFCSVSINELQKGNCSRLLESILPSQRPVGYSFRCFILRLWIRYGATFFVLTNPGMGYKYYGEWDSIGIGGHNLWLRACSRMVGVRNRLYVLLDDQPNHC